jgi:hypothetical protein
VAGGLKAYFCCDALLGIHSIQKLRRIGKGVIVGMSWAPEAMTDAGNWASNGLRFATKQEAEMYVAQFSSARSTRVIESFDQVNYRWENGRLVHQTSNNYY